VDTTCWLAGGERDGETKEDGAGEVHPPEITTATMNIASRKELQLCITGQVHTG
jgi:hypothetical protein